MTWLPEDIDIDEELPTEIDLPDVDDLQPVRSLEELRRGESATATERPAEPLTALQRLWGYDAFRAHQAEAIDAALDGRDALVILPTGGGKSLCYQVPSACREGLVLVISPLIALMDDQVAGAQAVGMRAGALHSMQSAEDSRQTRLAVLAGELDLLYVSPERFCIDGLVQELHSRLLLVAIDEAHCISHWGHDFRPEYRQLAQILDGLDGVPRMALTATATRTVQDDIVAQLGLRRPLRLVGHPDRPNLRFRCLPRQQAAAQALEVIRRYPGEGGIVYAQTRKEVDALAKQLRQAEVVAAAYHAGLSGDERQRVQSAFLAERIDVVVATIAFGMGIDRSNVRFVVHANAPKSIEHYQQEAGRAGRDGLPADCLLLYSGADFAMHRRLATLDGPLSPPREQALTRQLAEISRYAIAPVCRHRLLTEHFDEDYAPPTDAGCGACDVCLGETTMLPEDEALIAAQKIISAVWRCQSRFGLGHIVNVLVGKSTDMTRRHRHDELSVFGLMTAEGDRTVRLWADQLLVQGLLQQVWSDRFPLIALTDAGVALCKQGGQVRLTTPPPKPSRTRKGKAPAAVASSDWQDVDRELFTQLRIWRKLVAENLSTAPYLIFSDATLRELARQQPTERAGLLTVKGIGENKARRFGQALLRLIDGGSPETAVPLVQR